MTKKIHNKLICFFAVILLIFSLFGGVGGKAYASFENYTDVLADLQKDKNFNINDYPAIENNYSLQVITIAESTDGELFVYVYQPSANVKPLTATEINMSLTEDLSEYDDTLNDDNGGSSGGGGSGGGSHGCSLKTSVATKLYDLMLINTKGVFAKYKVNNFKVSIDPIRYYNITSIYRNWYGDIDDPTGNDNTINGVVFKVGTLFTVKIIDGQINYDCHNINVVSVTNKYVDFLRYLDGFEIGNWSMGSCDSHYIAFSCDYSIDQLYSADVYYSSQSFYHPSSGANQYGQIEDKYISLNYSDKVNNPADGIGGIKYTCERIERVSEFVEKEVTSNEVKKQLKDKQWVLRFCETEYLKSILPGSYGTVYTESKTLVTSVSILRLHFKSNGVVYNLGVVDNKQSGDDIPGNQTDKTLWEKFIDFCKFLESVTGVSYIIWAIIFLAVPVLIVLSILSIFIPPLRLIFKGIWVVIKYVFIALWWLVSLPFRGIYALIKKIKGSGE